MRRDIGDYFIGESRISSDSKKENYFIVGKVVGRFCEGVLYLVPYIKVKY